MLVLFVACAVVFRLASLAISIRHERALRRSGAVEYGAGNSQRLVGAHIVFYVAAAIEGFVRQPPFDTVAVAGLCLYIFGAVMLLVVVRMLGRFWTVKLMIAPDHELKTHALFRWVRHPNYFLNILPELVGYALVLHAYGTLIVGLAIYAVPLTVRIVQEERVMGERFAQY